MDRSFDFAQVVGDPPTWKTMAEPGAEPSVGHRRFLGLGATWLRSSILAACGSEGVASPSAAGSAVDVLRPERITYGGEPPQFGDLWMPDGEGPFPVLVLIHGGFWRASFDLTLMDDLAADAVRRRWAVWNIEYRRIGQDGGGWPGTFVDVAAAIGHLAQAVDRSAAPMDLDRVALAGHSAGGHLAAWALVRYVAAAERSHDPAVLAPFDGTHFDVLDPGHESWIDAAAWLRAYLQP